MDRFFTPKSNINLEQNTCVIEGEDVKHISRVLRCRENDKLEVCDMDNNEYICEIKEINKDNILLIPLGKAVEEVLLKLKDEGILSENQILIGFPHPSGANVNRLIQFEENKKKMIEFIEWKKFQ